jgi:DNA repair and recombination protein RAD52
MMDWDKASIELAKKLDPKNVHPPAKYGPKGDYLEGWFVIQEANRIFGFNGWSYDIHEVKCVSERERDIGQQKKPGFGVTYTARVCVIVQGVQRVDVGAGHGYDVDCGLAHESAIKEAVTDALKRGLRTFGNAFGLALYDKTRENVGVDEPTPTPITNAQRAYIATFKLGLDRCETESEVNQFWRDEKQNRANVGIDNKSLAWGELGDLCKKQIQLVNTPSNAADNLRAG